MDVKLSYDPSGRALSHGVASLLAARPKRAMDEDMVRLKSLLEGGKTTADQGRVHLEDLTTAPAPTAGRRLRGSNHPPAGSG